MKIGATQIKDSIWELCQKFWVHKPSNRPSFEDLFIKLAFNILKGQIENCYDQFYISKIDADRLFQYIELIIDDRIFRQFSEIESINLISLFCEKYQEDHSIFLSNRYTRIHNMF